MPAIYMNRCLKVGEASSKIVWQPGSKLVCDTAQARKRGSEPATMVAKSEPKLTPAMPIRSGSISSCAASQSMIAGPASAQAATLAGMPSTALSYCPGPSTASTAMPRMSQRSP